MACRYYFNGQEYDEMGFAAALREMPPAEAAKHMPGVEAVPSGPFSKTWPELAIKRMIRWAAENDFDRIAWPPGAVHAERFSLARQVDTVEAVKGRAGISLTVTDKNGRKIMDSEFFRPADYSKIGDTLGQDLAAKIVGQEEPARVYSGMDLSVGGEGMAGFYDQMLPATAQKLGKKFGARVGMSEVPTKPIGASPTATVHPSADGFVVRDDAGTQLAGPFSARNDAQLAASRLKRAGGGMEMQRVHSMDITPAMRESVVYEGQPQFAALPFDPTGAALGAGAGAASEGEDGQQGDPLRTLGGMAFMGAAGRMGRVKPKITPQAAQAAAEAVAKGGRRTGANAPVVRPQSAVPGAVRAATKLTDDRAAQRWAEDMLTDAAGSPRLAEMDPARPSTQSRINAAGIADDRIDQELAPAVERAAAAGLHNDLPTYLRDRHQKDILDDAYATAHEAVTADWAPRIADAQVNGANAGAIAHMEARAAAEAEKAGERAMRRAQPRGRGGSYEEIEARIQKIEDDAAKNGKTDDLNAAAKGVVDHNRATIERLRDEGLITAEDAQTVLDKYPNGVPTTAITRLLPNDMVKPVSVTEAFGGAAGEQVNPIVASRIFTMQAERAIQRNKTMKAFGAMVNDAMDAGELEMSAHGTPRLWGGGKDITFFHDGEKVTISVPSAVADGLEAAAGMGVSHHVLIDAWKRVNGFISSTITAGRASFLPMNMVRDAQDFATKNAALEGGPHTMPAALSTFFDEVGKGIADLAASNYNVRGVVGAGVGAATGVAQGDPDRPTSEKAVDALKGAGAGLFLVGANKTRITGNAAAFLARGGASGAINPGVRASERWYREVVRDGGAVARTPKDIANYLGDWMRDIASLQGVKAINTRMELPSRVATMRRAEARGADPVEAVVAGRDATYDPDRAGTLVRAANGAVPFLNAITQGGAQMARLMRDPKTRGAGIATLLTTALPAALIVEALNRNDPETSRRYDDVPQSAKDAGLVIMLPGTSRDARGERPNYVVWPTTGWATPIVAAVRELTRDVPGLESSAPRVGSDPEANPLERAADWIGAVVQMVSPIKFENPSDVASSFIPPGVKQLVEAKTNRSLYRGQDISSDSADERATAASRRIAEGLQGAGRAVGSDFLQGATPSGVDYAARQLPAYGDLYTGASDMVAPGPAKRGEERPVANQPFFGGIASRFVKDTGGANLQRAQDARLTEGVREVLADAGLPPSTVKPVPSRYKNATLTRDEQLAWQEATNTYLEMELANASMRPAWSNPAAREAEVQKAVTKARELAARDALGLTTTEIRQRIADEQARKAS